MRIQQYLQISNHCIWDEYLNIYIYSYCIWDEYLTISNIFTHIYTLYFFLFFVQNLGDAGWCQWWKKTATLASWAAGLAGPENMLDQLSDRMSEYMLGRMPEYVYIYICVCVR